MGQGTREDPRDLGSEAASPAFQFPSVQSAQQAEALDSVESFSEPQRALINPHKLHGLTHNTNLLFHNSAVVSLKWVSVC